MDEPPPRPPDDAPLGDIETPATPAAGETPAAPRKAPTWVILGFIVLLGGFYAWTQYFAHSAPAVNWYTGNLPSALAEAQKDSRRVFLYLYEQDDPIYQRNELAVFAERWARKPLAEVVCVRVALDPANPERVKLREQYHYRGRGFPLLLILDARGREISRTEGAVDQKAFYTFIELPARRTGEK